MVTTTDLVSRQKLPSLISASAVTSCEAARRMLSGPSATVEVPAGRYRVDTRVGIGNVRAVREIELKAGAASITLGATGSIKIQGTEVTVSAASIKLG